MTYAVLAETVSGASSAFGTPDQDYLLEARQMQALSFAVHIPLVCFGIAFPALVLFVEWLLPAHRRRALPRRSRGAGRR